MRKINIAILSVLLTASTLAESNENKLLEDEVQQIMEQSREADKEISNRDITVETYLKHGEKLEALEMQYEELKKRKDIINLKKDIINSVHGKDKGTPIPILRSTTNENKLKAELEKLKKKVVSSKSENKDPIEFSKVNEVFLKDGIPVAKIETFQRVDTLSVGDYLFSWRIVKISQKGIVIDKNGFRRNLGINLGS